MFESTHLEVNEFGALRLKLVTDWADVTDAVDFDYGTIAYPDWPEELGQLPDWYWPEVVQLHNEYREWRGRAA